MSVAVRLALIAALGISCGPPVRPAPPPPQPRTRLVVVLIVDQLSSWTFSREAPLMRHGIRTLIDGGIYFPAARFPYASTYTAPGHATIGTGASPATSGIISNSWYRRSQHRSVSAVADPNAPVLRIDGSKSSAAGRGVSAHQLEVPGIAEALRRATHGRGRSVSIGLKDRGAVLALGQRPDVVVWYDASQAAMTTSSAYAKAPPTWLTQLAADKPVSRFFDRVWRAGDKDLLAKHTGVADDRHGEGGEHQLGTTFPHRIAATKPPAKAIRATPFGTELTLDTAIAAIDGERLGADDIPDVLAISVSSHDYAGHFWGPGSWERLDLLLHLDAQVARLLTHLDRVVGKNRYAIVMTSDHGATPLVEHSRSKGIPARRIPADELQVAAQQAAQQIVGAGQWIQAISASAVYVSPDIPIDKRAAVLAAIATALRNIPGIAYAKPTAAISGTQNDRCETRSGLDAMACRSINRKQTGDVYFAASRYHVMTTTYHTGTSHGTPNPEDTDVPLIIYAPGRHKPSRVAERVSMLQIAPTVCALLGITPPTAATARALP